MIQEDLVMIGFFPDPYPDELLYSVFARYHQRTKYNSKSATLRDLLGVRGKITIDLPSSLEQLIRAMPAGNIYSVDRIIQENTLLPFYSPFLPPKRVIQLYDDMKAPKRASIIQLRIGINVSKIRLGSMRFCPLCVKEDLLQYGETYWHRLHQIPGVKACFSHGVWLEQSDLLLRQIRKQGQLMSANQIVPIVNARFLNMQLRNDQAHWYIAREVDWLFKNYIKGNNLNELRSRYVGLLLDRDLALASGIIHMQLLMDQFLEFYSNDLLNELCCGINRPFSWLLRILNLPRAVRNPIQYLLLMNFFGVTIKEFLSMPITPQPFGPGPWPCLNPACKYYRELIIADCHWRKINSNKGGLLGTFECECGFRYSLSKDSFNDSKNGKYKITRIESFGPVWETKLHQLHDDRNHLVCELAQQLGVTKHMLRKQERKLGLREPVHKVKNESEDKEQERREHKNISYDNSKQELYRRRLEEFIKENPMISRKDLRKSNRAIYTWIIHHDSQWLKNILLQNRPSTIPKRYVDWKQRDAGYAKAARIFADNVRLKSGRPIWLSKMRILRAIGAVNQIQEVPDLIPLTIEELDKVSETYEAFSIRLVQWAADSMRSENRPVTYSALVIRAGIDRNGKLGPVVQKKIMEVLDELNLKVPR